MFHLIKRFILHGFVLFFVVSEVCFATANLTPYYQGIWGIHAIGGVFTQNIFRNDIVFSYGALTRPFVLSVGPNYTFMASNPISRAADYLDLEAGAIGNINLFKDINGKENGQFEALFTLRYRDLPWQNWLNTSIALGVGPSYSTFVPQVEIDKNQNNPEMSRNFLIASLFEITVGLPQRPNWELVYRINHRSGCFGLLTPGRTDTNQLLFGLRYYFSR
jgi:hypothetical protein